MSIPEVKADIDEALRDYEVDGVPASGLHWPGKSALREALKRLAELSEVAGTTLVFETVAAMNAAPDPTVVGSRAEVRADPLGDVVDGNGIYSWDGTGWAWVSPLITTAVQDAIDAVVAAADAAIADVEAAATTALGSIKNSDLIPSTFTQPNANDFTVNPVAPHAVSGTTQTFIGLFTGTNTGTLRATVAGIGQKELVFTGGRRIPKRFTYSGMIMMLRYSATLDKYELLSHSPPAAVLNTVPNLTTVSTSSHLRLQIANGGRFLTHPDSEDTQTFEMVALADKPFGNFSITIYEEDGTTPIITGLMYEKDNTTLISEANAWRANDTLRVRFKAGRARMLVDPDRSTSRLAYMVASLVEPQDLPSIDRPVTVTRTDDITWLIKVYPHNNHYRSGKKRKIGSDFVCFALIDMGTFHAGDDPYAPALNSYWCNFGFRLIPISNLMYDAVVSGITTDNGQVPSTVEPPFYTLKTTDGTGVAVAAGNGHSNILPDTWTMIGTTNDGSTGNVDVTSSNLRLLPVGKTFGGDKIVNTSSGYLNTSVGAAEKHSRYTYTLTIESHPDYQLKLDTKYDTTDVGVNISPATVNGNMAWIWPLRCVDRAAGFLNGVPVAPPGPGNVSAMVLALGQMDNGQRSMGMIDELWAWDSENDDVIVIVKNTIGNGYSHKENGAGVARTAPSFISTFGWGNKLYGDPFRTAAGVQNIVGKIFEMQSTICMIRGVPPA
jgi:hypothetical protein